MEEEEEREGMMMLRSGKMSKKCVFLFFGGSFSARESRQHAIRCESERVQKGKQQTKQSGGGRTAEQNKTISEENTVQKTQKVFW